MSNDTRPPVGQIRTAYTLETADEMLSALRALPPMDRSKRKLTKQALVAHLAREIASLQRRGYTIEQVTDSLRGIGLEITTPTLKSYLQRTKARDAKEPRTTQRMPAARPLVTAPEARRPKGAATELEADSPDKRSGKGAFLIKDKDSY